MERAGEYERTKDDEGYRRRDEDRNKQWRTTEQRREPGRDEEEAPKRH